MPRYVDLSKMPQPAGGCADEKNEQSTEPSQTPEPKLTNKDVLLAAFPDACISPDGIPDACPLSLDKHYDCNKFPNCLRCKRAHWLAESEEK